MPTCRTRGSVLSIQTIVVILLAVIGIAAAALYVPHKPPEMQKTTIDAPACLRAGALCLGSFVGCCPGLACSPKGGCVQISAPTCADTEASFNAAGYWPLTQGATTGVMTNGTNGTFTDSCQSSQFLTEYHCSQPSGQAGNVLAATVNCQQFNNGTCANGACQFTTPICTDSESSYDPTGYWPFTQGTTSGLLVNGTMGNFTDYCQNSQYLVEYRCQYASGQPGYVSWVLTNCQAYANSCSSGYCQ